MNKDTKTKKCLYCNSEIEREGFCSREHKVAYRIKEDSVLNKFAPVVKSRGMSPEEIKMQNDFLKKSNN